MPVQAILDAGPLDLQRFDVPPTILQGLRESYAKAVSATNVASTIAMCVSVVTVFGMQWRNLKHVAAEREHQKKQNDDATKDEHLVHMGTSETKLT